MRQPVSAEEAKRLISEQLPDELASVLSPDEAEAMRQKLAELSQPSARPPSPKDDALSAAGSASWFLRRCFRWSIAFLFIGEVRPALRLSNAVAIVMMFLCGYVFARCTGLRPWPTGLVMVAIACAMVGAATALGS